jgi:hypothetical protein
MYEKIILVLLLIAAIAAPVAATNVMYPDEYYAWGNGSLQAFNSALEKGSGGLITNDYVARGLLTAQWFELRRQTILMERQNELLEEQNDLLRQLVPKTPQKMYFEVCNQITGECFNNESGVMISTSSPGYYNATRATQ